MLSTLWCKLSWSGWGCDLLGLERLEGWQFQTLEGTDMEGSLGSWMKRNHDKLDEFCRIQHIYCIFYHQMERHKWNIWIYYYLSWIYFEFASYPPVKLYDQPPQPETCLANRQMILDFQKSIGASFKRQRWRVAKKSRFFFDAIHQACHENWMYIYIYTYVFIYVYIYSVHIYIVYAYIYIYIDPWS